MSIEGINQASKKISKHLGSMQVKVGILRWIYTIAAVIFGAYEQWLWAAMIVGLYAITAFADALMMIGMAIGMALFSQAINTALEPLRNKKID